MITNKPLLQCKYSYSRKCDFSVNSDTTEVTLPNVVVEPLSANAKLWFASIRFDYDCMTPKVMTFNHCHIALQSTLHDTAVVNIPEVLPYLRENTFEDIEWVMQSKNWKHLVNKSGVYHFKWIGCSEKFVVFSGVKIVITRHVSQ